MTIQARRAVPEDAVAVAAIVESAYTPYVERIGRRPAPMDDDYAARIVEDEVWVVDDTESDGVAGVLVLVPHHEHLLLDNVAVDPEQSGRGIGERLLDLAEERATAHGLDLIRLYTHVLMTENQRRYLRRGYVETHRGGQAGFERVFFEKRL